MVHAEFDLQALYAALDEQRRSRDMTWAAVTREINAPDDKIPGRKPIATSTITALRNSVAGHHSKGEHCDIVLSELIWLLRTPESFVPGMPWDPASARLRPDPAKDKGLRFDTRALYKALNAERKARGMTWAEVALETGVGSTNPLTNLAKGGRTGIRMVMRIVGWLDQPAASFTKVTNR